MCRHDGPSFISALHPLSTKDDLGIAPNTAQCRNTNSRYWCGQQEIDVPIGRYVTLSSMEKSQTALLTPCCGRNHRSMLQYGTITQPWPQTSISYQERLSCISFVWQIFNTQHLYDTNLFSHHLDKDPVRWQILSRSRQEYLA